MDLYDYCTQGAGQVRACASDHICQQDPRNFHLLGLPPVDMLEEVAKALRAAGLDVVVSAFFGSYSLTVASWSGFRLSIAPPCRGVSAESNFNLERLRVQVVFRRRPHLRQAREAAVLAYAGACQAPAAARNPVASAGGHRRESNRGLKVAPTIQGLNDDPFDVGSTLKRPI